MLLLLPAVSRGEGPPPEQVLNELMVEALRSNHLLSASDAAVAGAAELAKAADRLPDPTLSAGYSPVALETRGGPQRARVSASQSFPFFGKRGLRKEVAESEAVEQEHMRDDTAARVLFDVKATFWEVYGIDRSLAIAEEEHGLLGDILGAVEASYRTGTGYQANLFQVQLMQTKIENRIIRLEGMRSAAVDRMASAVGKSVAIPALSELEAPLLVIDSSVVLEEAEHNNPRIAASKEEIRKSELQLALTRKDYYPDFALAAGWAEVGKSDLPGDFNGRDSWSVGAMLKVPLYRGDIKDRERSRRSALEADRQRYEDERLRVTAGALAQLRKIDALEASIDLFTTGLIPQAQSTYESAMAGYTTGELQFADLILAERSLLEVKLGYHESVAQYRARVAELERDVGYRTPDSVFSPRSAR